MKARLPAKLAQSASRAPEIGQRLFSIEAPEQPQNAPLSNLPGRPDLKFSLSRIPIFEPGNSSEHHERRLQPSSPATSPLQRIPLRRRTSERAPEPAERPSRTFVQQLAMRAIDTPAETLPYARRIQRSFGHHNIDTMRVHQGPIARANARSMQARAFAAGNHIVFADTPDLHTAAHEAAHVVQQRNGVHLPGGIDTPGDRYERHAEAVARQVIGGYSAELLLDHIPGSTQLRARASDHVATDTGKSASGVLAPLATGVSIQRVKMKALKGEKPEPLTLDEQKAQKKYLQEVKGEEVEELKTPLEEDEKKQIRIALLEDAQKVLQSFNVARVKKPDEVRPGHKAVWKKAVEEVFTEYGPYVKEAVESFLAKKEGIQYKNVESRWEELKGSDDAVTNEFPAALQYMFDNAVDFEKVNTVLQEIAGKHESNRVGVEEAFTSYVTKEKPDKELMKILVELRVRWSPYTLGNTIYAEQQEEKVSAFKPKSKEQTQWLNTLKLEAWGNYKQMIHEVVHTAAHPNFKDYLKQLPPYVHNIIDEGTTDYFALQIWEKIQAPFTHVITEQQRIAQAGTDEEPPVLSSNDKKLAKLVQGIQKAISSGAVNAQNLIDLSVSKKFALYKEQEAAIKKMTTSLENGENRLKAAYFYGEVNRFFPPAELFYKEEDESEGEKEEDIMQGEGEKEEDIMQGENVKGEDIMQGENVKKKNIKRKANEKARQMEKKTKALTESTSRKNLKEEESD